MKALRIVRWEFGKSVRSKGFMIMSLVVPALIAMAAYAIALARDVQPITIIDGEPVPPFLIAVILAVLLFVGAFISSVTVFYAVLKEKASRVVELMLSTVSARDLMVGKIVGLGGAGLLMTLVWVAMVLFVGSRFVALSLWVLSPLQLSTYPLFFILGYMLIATMYAVAASTMKDIHSGGVQGLVGLIPYMPVALTALIVDKADAAWMRGIQFFPPFIPSVMMIRLAVTDVPLWEVILGLLVVLCSVCGLMVFAARVFETALLMYGKTASLREIWRWGIHRTRQ